MSNEIPKSGSPRLIDRYLSGGRWDKVPDPLPDPCGEKEIKAAGFEKYDRLGTEFGTNAIIYSGAEGFLVVFSTFTHGHDILVPNFAALLELIQLLKPWLDLTMKTRMVEMVDRLDDLLLEGAGRTEGPFAASLEAEERQRRHLREQRKKQG